MLAAPLLFLADAITGSAIGKMAFWVGLATVPVVVRKKEAMDLQAKYGFIPTQEQLVLVEQSKRGTATMPSALEGQVCQDPLRYMDVPAEMLPPELAEYAGRYLLTSSERIELSMFLMQAQADLQAGQQGEFFGRVGIGPNFFVHPDDFIRLQAKVRLLRDHYTPMRVKRDQQEARSAARGKRS